MLHVVLSSGATTLRGFLIFPAFSIQSDAISVGVSCPLALSFKRPVVLLLSLALVGCGVQSSSVIVLCRVFVTLVSSLGSRTVIVFQPTIRNGTNPGIGAEKAQETLHTDGIDSGKHKERTSHVSIRSG